jgi:hypothetical protein
MAARRGVRPNHIGNRAQGIVADRMAVVIVYLLEVINVDGHERIPMNAS